MKRKLDFITNSSSTTFMFIFKGDTRIDLFRAMVEHEKDFNLVDDFFNELLLTSINVWDIISKLDEVIQTPTFDKLWIYPHVSSIPLLLREFEEELKSWEKDLANRSNDGSDLSEDFYIRNIRKSKDKITTIKNAIERGFNSFVKVDFGDNHGEIQGGKIGTVMDYSGRYININDDSLIVVTEQNR